MTKSETYSEREIINRWFPLMLSRFFMVLETPMAAFALARFADPEINLSVFGALFIPIIYFFEAPSWNFIGSAASLVRSKEDLKVLRQLLYVQYTVSVAIFLLLFATPIAKYSIIPFFGTTPELFSVVLPSLFIGMTYPLFVGYRRMNHGILVYAGKSKLVGINSVARIVVLGICLPTFYLFKSQLSGNTIVAICIAISYLVGILTPDEKWWAGIEKRKGKLVIRDQRANK